MIEFKITRPLRRSPSHPGELMREIIEEQMHMPVAEAAQRMQISRQALYAVLNCESAVTAEMALRFGKLTGAEPSLYVQMQGRHDLWQAEQRLGAALRAIEAAV
jgi:antitoxin HigA-1